MTPEFAACLQADPRTRKAYREALEAQFQWVSDRLVTAGPDDFQRWQGRAIEVRDQLRKLEESDEG